MTMDLHRWVGALAGLLVTSSVAAIPLDLANAPLVTGSNVPPNILVAVDDSGSMDMETLFPTDDGLLAWNSNRGDAWYNGTYRRYGTEYGYLFPNGYTSRCYSGGYDCDSDDRRIYSRFEALPPTPQLAFARAAAFNRSYFDPSAEYTPWVGGDYGGASFTHARADPVSGTDTFDLTSENRVYLTGYTFQVLPGMRLGGLTIATGYQCVDGKGNDRDRDGRCRDGYEPNWHTYDSDQPISDSAEIGIAYYPATFYLPAGQALPDDYGWADDAQTLTGYAPDGQPTLTGYEIKEDNFTSTEEYVAAMQNFANWFVYFRKRHLATRGGITRAFSRITDARTGECTINGRYNLQMRALTDNAQRASFYNDIYTIDYSSAQGTPNRKALAHLGDQLETRSDLITSPCQQNFAILFTDGFSNGDFDKTRFDGSANVDGNSKSADVYGAPFGDSEEATLADIAMEMYTHLDPANGTVDGNRVPVSHGCDVVPPELPDPGLDCQRDPHVVTFGVTLGQRGFLFNSPMYPGIQSDPWNQWPDGLEWPNSDQQGRAKIDDLWHATINSRGKLLNARTPGEVADAFTSALQEITQRKGSANGVAANGGSLTLNSVIYQATFIGGAWEGDLTAYRLSPDNFGTIAKWRASDKVPDDDQRTILTSRGAPGDAVRTSGAAFTRDGIGDVLSDRGISAQAIDYLRGDDSREQRNGGEYRDRRTTVLGDFVHSSPQYVGPPDRLRLPSAGQWRDAMHPEVEALENALPSYSTPGASAGFLQRRADRPTMVYVGSNDAMLHAFDAESGVERFAYVPSGVFDHLSELLSPNYAHRYYVDGTPVESDAAFDGAWHSVLVGGLANGGNSLYALDVTTPGLVSEAKASDTVLWEAHYPQMGQTYGQPSIVRLHNNTWGVMAGNGYNSDAGQASLYVLGISDGRRIRRLDTGVGAVDGGPDNGLSEPFPVDIDGDFIVDYAYAGDLRGNLWRFDLTSIDPQNWNVTRLFTATRPGAADETQPITAEPQVSVHPYGRQYGVMVYFGTGKYLESDDAVFDTSVRNTVYGVWDLDVSTFNNARGPGKPLFETSITDHLNRSALVTQSITRRVDNRGETYRVISNNSVAYQRSASDPPIRGWALDLTSGTGERVITDATRAGDVLGFATLLPSEISCRPENSGFYMLVDPATGGRTAFPAYDLNGDGAFTRPSDVLAGAETGEPSTVASGIEISQGAPNKGRFLVNRSGQDDRLIVPSGDGGVKQLDVNTGRQPDRRRSWRRVRR